MARYFGSSLYRRTWWRELRHSIIVVVLATAVQGSYGAQEPRVLGMRAMATGDWEAAVQHWTQDTQESALPYLQHSRAEWRRQQVQPYLNQAEVARQAENWKGAQAAYRKAQEVSPYSKAAHDGLMEIGDYVKAHRELAKLDLGEGLYDKAMRAQARQWLQHINEKRLHDRLLDRTRAQLDALLRQMQVPRPLILTSDGQSELEIYGIGKLGRVERETLELLPGNYIVVATRLGFRDARRTLKVRPGKTLTVDLRCTERI